MTAQLHLTPRHAAMLRAVAAGRAELTCSRIPDLYVDGRCCTDHAASALLVRAGLIDRAGEGGGDAAATGRVPARVTPAGAALLAEVATAGAVAPQGDPRRRTQLATGASGR